MESVEVGGDGSIRPSVRMSAVEAKGIAIMAVDIDIASRSAIDLRVRCKVSMLCHCQRLYKTSDLADLQDKHRY